MLKRAKEKLPSTATEGGRFEIPKVEMHIEGNKTIIHNFDAITGRLRRDKQLLSKFLSRELAVPTVIDGPRLILHGKILKRLIDDKLKKFIKKYVLCGVCGRPDTIIREFQGVKTLVCEACGARTPIR